MTFSSPGESTAGMPSEDAGTVASGASTQAPRRPLGSHRTGLHASVLDALGAEIVSGATPAEAVVRIDQLAERFGVSRSVVREAVRQLFQRGDLVEGDRVLLTHGDHTGRGGGTNTLKLLSVGPDGIAESLRDL